MSAGTGIPTQRPDFQPPRLPFQIKSETIRVILMGTFLAALLYLVFFHDSGRTPRDPSEPTYEQPEIEAPTLDRSILAQVEDDTRDQRLLLEPAVLRHLLEKSLNVGPAAARALGMPDESVPVPRVREDKGQFRGSYLWYEGRLEELSAPKGNHPVWGYSIYEAKITTAEGDPVMVAFSKPPAAEIERGDWVRVEGFFMKLRDTSFPTQIDAAPMLVGPYMRADYEDWAPVTEFDPSVMAVLRDGEFIDGDFVATPDTERPLRDDQAEPLWHLAAYAMSERNVRTRADWRKVPPLNSKERLVAIKNGETPKGTPIRVLGTFVQAKKYEADVNPIGVEYWTEALVRVHDELKGKLIPVWIPGTVPDDVHNGTGLEIRGYLYKRYTYEALNGGRVITPVVVAATLDHYVMESHPIVKQLAWGFAGLVAVIVLLFAFMALRDNRASKRHEETLIERRRKRRAREGGARAIVESPQ